MNKWTRRALITTGSLAGGGLVLGVGAFVFAPNRIGLGRHSAAGRQALTTWVAIDTAGGIHVTVPHADLGQGSQTALAMMLVDELDGDWSQVTVTEAPAEAQFANNHIVAAFMPLKRLPQSMRRGADYFFYREMRRRGLQVTGGSASVRGTGQYGMRVAGAAARDMLVRAAATRWQVAAGECTVAKSIVQHTPSGRKLGFGELSADAGKLDPPARPPLKSPQAFTLIGTPQRRLDVPGKVDGSARYGIDAWFPGMLFAAVRAAPVFGAKLTSCDSAAAEKMPGVKKVLRYADAVAVVADSSFRAQRALDSLQPQFAADAGHLRVSSDSLLAQRVQAISAGPFKSEITTGDGGKIFSAAGTQQVSARYEVPYLHHATMEPMSATARFEGGKLEIWTSVQDPLNAAYVAAGELKIDSDDVILHNGHVGGGFGRRLPGNHDYVLQVVRIARDLAPAAVKLVWSREEDTTHGYYRPAASAELSAVPGPGASLLAWRNRSAGADEAFAARPAYAVSNLAIEFVDAPSHVRTGAWRSVGHSQHGFFVESFIDELAAQAKRDPYQYRYDLLAAEPRARAVLARAAEMSGWGKALEPNRARGIAMVPSFGSYVAEVAEIEITRDAAGKATGLRVVKVYAAVDCGILVNPMTAEEQIQGGIVMGLSAALGEAITIDAGAVREQNFHQYSLLRMPDAPQIAVEFIASTELPGGLGEPGTPPIAAAVANAWFAATGQRLRQLPLLAAIAAS